METGKLGKEFLLEYRNKSKPRLMNLLDKEIEELSVYGKIPKKSLVSLKELFKGGKGIRGSLVTLGYIINNGQKNEDVIDASLAMEILHLGLLIHDDLMDNDNKRHGIETLHYKFSRLAPSLGIKCNPKDYGMAIAVCVGDYAFYLSWKTLIESGFPPERILKASEIINDVIIHVAMGQELDMTVTGDKDASEKDIFTVMTMKTGEYTCYLPLMLGSLLAGDVKKELNDAYKRYSEYFGWAFQIQDDHLGMFGSEEKLGKPVGSDLREGKNTLFVHHLRKNGDSKDVEYMESILGSDNLTQDQVEKMREIFKKSGTYDYVIKTGWENVEKGCKAAEEITDIPETQSLLKSILIYMMERTR